MSAFDTFDWLVATAAQSNDVSLTDFLKSHRAVLLRLRSEDERQRYVNNVLKELKGASRRRPAEARP